jgi:2-iminobutanoate/2-iminopropanoate deaminase
MKKIIVLTASLLVLSFASFAEDAAAPKASKEFFDASGGRAPFSSAVRVGDTLYMSGALGTKDRKLAEGGTGAETAQALENIKARLAEHGLAMSDVVKCTVFLADMADFGAMNEAYTAAFAPPRPTRSALGVSGLAFNANVEIECIAAF